MFPLLCLYKILGKTFPIQIGKEKLINFASLSFSEYFFIYFDRHVRTYSQSFGF